MGLKTIPKYQQILKDFTEKIRNGEFAAGTRLPGERVLADELGVSVITVSRVMRELQRSGFIRRCIGSGTFVTEREKSFSRPRIGLFTQYGPQPGDYGISIIAGTLFAYWSRRGYDVVLLCGGAEDYEPAIESLQLDGICVYSPPVEFIAPLQRLRDKGIPVVALSSILPELAGISFGYSNHRVLDAAVKYLMDLGIRDLAFLIPEGTASPYVLRREGFLRAMWKYRLPFNPDWSITVRELEQDLKKLMSMEPRPQGLILGSCKYAKETMLLLEKWNLRVPEDVSLLVIDENQETLMMKRQLTVFRVNFVQLTLEGSEALKKMIDHESPEISGSLNFEFIDRHTCQSHENRKG